METIISIILGVLLALLYLGVILLKCSDWDLEEKSDRLLSNHNLRLIDLEKIHEKELKKLEESKS